jgi:hypothetical protein
VEREEEEWAMGLAREEGECGAVTAERKMNIGSRVEQGKWLMI